MKEKVFHPTMERSTVQELEPEMLDLAACFLHDLGWFTQQCGIERALEHIRWWYDTLPDAFLKGCANGLTLILDALPESEPEQPFGTSHIQQS